MNKIPKSIIEEIREYSKSIPDQEICGIIHLKKKEFSFKKCKNTSPNPRFYFSIDCNLFLEYDVKYVVHSHIVGSANPSESDIMSSNELCIPYLIYSLRDDDFYLYENISV